MRVRTTDQGGLWYEEAGIIATLDTNEPAPVFYAPVITEGTVVLRWSSLLNHRCSLYYSTNLLNGFSVLPGDMPGTPPMNTYTTAVNGSATGFRKVTTEE
ncbi:MAG: hypothetical protein MUC65_08295 [Pontiellaceae bacterium]|nr:hypothetical protein [Pontiellaceae bacterium]